MPQILYLDKGHRENLSPLRAKVLGLQGVVPEDIHTHPMEDHQKY